MFRAVIAACALQLVVSIPALCCDGQTGSVIFEDTFQDDSGGWPLSPPLSSVVPPNLVINLTAKVSNVFLQNLTFNATDGDYCTEFYLPKPTSADNPVTVALMFWGTSTENTLMVQLSSKGSLDFWKRVGGAWLNIFSQPSVASFNAAPDGLNSLRLIAKTGRLTFFVNGTQVKVIRSQVPAGQLMFGLYSQMQNAVDGLAPVRVKSFKVTSGQ